VNRQLIDSRVPNIIRRKNRAIPDGGRLRGRKASEP